MVIASKTHSVCEQLHFFVVTFALLDKGLLFLLSGGEAAPCLLPTRSDCRPEHMIPDRRRDAEVARFGMIVMQRMMATRLVEP